jgi:heat shock protein HslJ
MHFGALISTKMACVDQALNQQEVDFFGALRSTDRFTLSGDTLTLMKGTETVARLRP